MDETTGNLTFTPAANANGSATVSVYLTDSGSNVAPNDNTSPTQTFTLTVTAVNDEPSFSSGGNVTVNEDSGAYSAVWATAISKGPANESGQTLTFHVSNDNNSLFSAQPNVDETTGNLTFTPAANANGSATVSVYLTDSGSNVAPNDNTSPTQTFTLTVTAVNDEPSFSSGGNVTVNEDSGAYSAVWATAISKGPANESGQTLTFHVSNDNNSLFSAQPNVDETTGNLTFTPAANANGSATVSVYLTDSGSNVAPNDNTSPTQTFTLTVTAVNDAPAGTDKTVTTLEDTAYTFTAADFGFSDPNDTPANALAAVKITTLPTAGHAEAQRRVTVTAGDLVCWPTIAAGKLKFYPGGQRQRRRLRAASRFKVQDDGGTANGGVDLDPTANTITVNVTSVNDAPAGTDKTVTILEDASLHLRGRRLRLQRSERHARRTACWRSRSRRCRRPARSSSTASR